MGVRVQEKIGFPSDNLLLLSLFSLYTFTDACPPYLLHPFFKFPSLFLFSLSLHLFLSPFLSQLRNNAFFAFHTFFCFFYTPKPKSKHSCLSKATCSRPSNNKTQHPHWSPPSLHAQDSLSLSHIFGGDLAPQDFAWMSWLASKSKRSFFLSHQGQPNIHFSCHFHGFFSPPLCIYFFSSISKLGSECFLLSSFFYLSKKKKMFPSLIW